MDNDINFETYLFIGTKKIIISVYSESNKKIYEKILLIEYEQKKLDFDKLDHFLNENIFKIEKLIKNFIKKIFIILDVDEFLSIELSIKNNSYENKLISKNLNYLLKEAKDCCNEAIEKKKIIHMIIQNYNVDGKNYSFFPNNSGNSITSLDIKFISLSSNFIKKLEEILKKYHISLNQLVSANYIKEFLKNEDNIFLMTKKILQGHNPNEVILINKMSKNKGFFEKFFDFFS